MPLKQARMVQLLRIGAIAVGAACMLYGISRGEAGEVMRKAVRICLECIGVA